MSIDDYCDKVITLMGKYTGMSYDSYFTKEGVTLEYYFEGRHVLDIEVGEEIKFVYFDCSELRLDLKEVFRKL